VLAPFPGHKQEMGGDDMGLICQDKDIFLQEEGSHSSILSRVGNTREILILRKNILVMLFNTNIPEIFTEPGRWGTAWLTQKPGGRL
jgi:hypothetical protein